VATIQADYESLDGAMTEFFLRSANVIVPTCSLTRVGRASYVLAITECGLSNLAEKCLFSAAFFRFSAIRIIFLGRRSEFGRNRFDTAAGFDRLPLCLAAQRQGVAA
jgi:hypothetical protein